MNDITIAAHDARLSVLGYQPEVKRIYWSALPEKLPTYGQLLDLSGCEIKAIYADGSEAVVTPYCTFSPDTGATVPNAETMTVTATYTARSGKVCQADETLPVCVPSYIKIIVPSTVAVIKENALTGPSAASVGWSQTAIFFGFNKVETYLYWTRNGDVVAIRKVNPTYGFGTGFYFGGPNPYFRGLSHELSSQTYTRYLTPTYTEEVEADYAASITASYTIYGVTLTTEAYLEADIIESLKLRAIPSSYIEGETETVTLTTASNVRVQYKSGDIVNCSAINLGAGFYDYFNIPHIYNSQTITIGDNQSGSIPLAFYSNLTAYSITAEYDCADGAVEWTPEGILL